MGSVACSQQLAWCSARQSGPYLCFGIKRQSKHSRDVWRCSHRGGCANRRYSLSGSASQQQSLFEALFCSGRQLSRAAGELFPSGLLLESVVRPFSVYLFVVAQKPAFRILLCSLVLKHFVGSCSLSLLEVKTIILYYRVAKLYPVNVGKRREA